MRSLYLYGTLSLLTIAIACESNSFEEKYKNGKLKSQGQVQKHDDGTFSMIGPWTFWYQNGQKKASGQFRDGRKFASRDQLGVPKNAETAKRQFNKKAKTEDKKKGDQGIPKEGRTGLWTFWFENGKKLSEGQFIDGQPHGSMTNWFDSGNKLSSGNYKNGRPDGEWTSWHENGVIASKGSYIGGKQDGVWTYWFENGQKSIEGRSKNGVKPTRALSRHELEWE